MKTRYIIITPVHNEEKYIEQVIKSVILQTILPKKWIIVDDASEDRTPQIVAKYQKQYDFIECYRFEPGDIESYYSSRTYAFLAGYEKVRQIEYDFLAALDADLTLESTYYEHLLEEFDRNPRLGIASGIYMNKIGSRLEKVLIDMNDSPGAIQMFRRQCYEDIGGYIPQKYGGDDSCASIMARMKGWQTRSFSQYKVIHHRAVGTGDGRSVLGARFRQGLTEYSVATHPLFMLAKSFRRAFLEKPYFIGSAARMVGFLYGYWLKDGRKIPAEGIHFVRREQINRLIRCVCKHKGD